MTNLIKSKLRSKLLEYYFTHPEADLYIRELGRAIAEDPTNLLRELTRLEKEGMFISQLRGKQKYFRLNKAYPLYKDLRNMVSKTFGVEKNLAEIAQSIKGVEICFIYGSYAKNKEKAGSDIDLFIIGEKVDIDKLLEKINRLEKKLDREVNYRIFSSSDFQKAVREKNSFILNVIKNKKIFLIGDERNLRKLN